MPPTRCEIIRHTSNGLANVSAALDEALPSGKINWAAIIKALISAAALIIPLFATEEEQPPAP